MRCDELESLIDLYLDGELPEEAQARVDRHLLRCQACSFQVRTLEQTLTLLHREVEPIESSPAFRERTLARLLDALSANLHRADPEDASQRTLPFG